MNWETCLYIFNFYSLQFVAEIWCNFIDSMLFSSYSDALISQRNLTTWMNKKLFRPCVNFSYNNWITFYHFCVKELWQVSLYGKFHIAMVRVKFFKEFILSILFSPYVKYRQHIVCRISVLEESQHHLPSCTYRYQQRPLIWNHP